jgi:predicted AlkP superfamily phosphohydrolase/phosphomutase
MKRFFLYLLIFFSIPILILSPSCTRNPAEISKQTTVVFGMDGASWEIIDMLIDRGELPNFSRLKQSGAWGKLQTIIPTESVAIWTSIATGMSPSRHNIQSFMRRLPGQNKYVATPGTGRRVPALWNIASDAGLKVVSVKWYATWPAEKINGAMLSPRLEPDSGGDETYPPELFKEITDFRYKSTMDKLPQPPKPSPKPQDPNFEPSGNLLSQHEVSTKMFDDTSVWEAGYYVFQKCKPDLFLIYLKSTDRVQHYLWGAQNALTKPNPSEIELAEAEAIFGWYRYYDSLIAKILEIPSVTLYIMSDHGFESSADIKNLLDLRYLSMDTLLTQLGYQTRLAEKKTDFSNTRLYEYRSMPYDWSFEINLNLSGREPAGVVLPQNADEMKNEVIESLRQIHTIAGRPLFKEISHASDECDLVCRLDSAISTDEFIRIGGQDIPLKNFISVKAQPRGCHIDGPPGIFIAFGPGIRSNYQIKNAHVYDIAPTVLRSLDLPFAKDSDGTCLSGIFSDEFSKAHPEKQIDSYGTRRMTEALLRSNEDEKLRNELRAMGYIE